MEQTQKYGDFTPLINRLTRRGTPKARPITAHFATLRKAVNEARKYGVTQRYNTIRMQRWITGAYTHQITHDRTLTISFDETPDRPWKLVIDVSGRVKPANVKMVSVRLCSREDMLAINV